MQIRLSTNLRKDGVVIYRVDFAYFKRTSISRDRDVMGVNKSSVNRRGHVISVPSARIIL